MSNKDLLQCWKITTLTPLHIGDGEELALNLDYVQVHSGVEVIHTDDLLEALGDIPGAITEIGGRSFHLADFVRQYKLTLSPLYTLKYSGRPPQSIRRFIKDAYCRPYLPGSSLKGAIRTALWVNLDRAAARSPSRNYKGFKKRINGLAGDDPHHDFLRPLNVSDSNAVDPADTLQIAEIKYFNLLYNNRPGWKDFRSNNTINDFKKASGLQVEALKPGVELVVNAALEGFLNIAYIKSAARIPVHRGTENLVDLASVVNSHSLSIAQSELNFFSEFGAATAPARGFYQYLVAEIDRMKANSGSFILRLAWGSGWKGMTGDWMDEDTLEVVRRIEKLGRRGHPVFPKTRRLAMKDGVPSLPMGWILVEPAGEDEFVKRALKIGDSRDSVPEPSREPQPKPPDPEEMKKERIASFERMLTHVQNLPGEIERFIENIQREEDETAKREMCLLLLEKANSLPKKRKFSRALSNGKSWAEKLKLLCDEIGVQI